MLFRQHFIDEITYKLLEIRLELMKRNKLGLYDDNLMTENFFCGFLNILNGWKLRNVNLVRSSNPGFDLIDEENQIAVQVTSIATREKIQHSLNSFSAHMEGSEPYQFFMLIITEKQNYYRNNFHIDDKIVFDKDTDIWDISDLINQIKSQDTPMWTLEKLNQYLAKELVAIEKERQKTSHSFKKINIWGWELKDCVFVCYAHEDTDKVSPIYHSLREAGLKFIYCEDLELGDIYAENLHSTMNDCAAVLLFISNQANSSVYFRNVVRFAIECKKTIIPVYIEETQLTDGLRLQLMPLASIYLYKGSSLDEFEDRLRNLIPEAFIQMSVGIDTSDIHWNILDVEVFEEERYLNRLMEMLLTDYDKAMTYLNTNFSREVQEKIIEIYSFLFSISETGEVKPAYENRALQKLVYRLFLIDEGYDGSANQEPKVPSDDSEKASEDEGINNNGYVPQPKDLEKATQLVVSSFEAWVQKRSSEPDIKFCFVKKKIDEEALVGTSVEVKKHSHRQTTGLQFGYDIGMNTSVNATEYRLCFECKNYIRLDNRNEDNSSTTLTVDAYSYNLLQFFMHCNKALENRWVLVCPFGDLGNDFQEKLFDEWNRTHPYMQIAAFTQSQTAMTCEQFLSLNPEAYKLVYGCELPEIPEQQQEEGMKYLFNLLIGKNAVRKSVHDHLRRLQIPEDFIGHGQLMNVLTDENIPALESCLAHLSDPKHKDLFLLGEYGSGKTWLVSSVIEEILKQSGRYQYIPVFASLKQNELAKIDEIHSGMKPKDIEEKIEKVAESFISNILTPEIKEYGNQILTKPILFVLDGFDEVLSGLSATAYKIDFLYAVYYGLLGVEEFKNARFIITSRETDYEACTNHDKFSEILDRFEVLHLKECSEEEALNSLKEIADLKSTNEAISEQFRDIDETSSIVALAKRPVILKLIKQAASKGKGGFRTVYKDEFDILADVVEKTIECKDENATEDNKKERIRRVREQLETYAFEMTKCQGTNEIEIKKDFEELIQNGAISIIHLKTNDTYRRILKFQHNIVREFLVAEYLFRHLKIDMESGGSLSPQRNFLRELVSINLTPEMQHFFFRFIESEGSDSYIQAMEKALELRSVKTNPRYASALLSLLMQPGRSLRGTSEKMLDLSYIRANNLNMWHCSMEHVDMNHAQISGWQMLDMHLHNIDFSNAKIIDLKLGSDEPIRDIDIRKSGTKHYISVLYEKGRIVEFEVELRPDSIHYIPKVKESGKQEHIGITHTGDKVLLYEPLKIYRQDSPDPIYELQSGENLIKIQDTGNGQLIEYYRQSESETLIFDEERILAKLRNVQEVSGPSKDALFYRRKDTIYAYVTASDKEQEVLSLEGMECFTSMKDRKGGFTLFVKVGEGLNKYHLDELYQIKTGEEKNLTFIKKKPDRCQSLYVLSRDYLCALGEKALYIIRIEKNEAEISKLQMKVNCEVLTLDNMGDELTYKMLSENNRTFQA